MMVLALFTLGNSSDAFLLLRLSVVAGTVRFVPLMWAALHVVKASVSMAAGSWSDRIGRRTVMTIGWLVYAVVYAGFALSASIPTLLAWFLVYGFYFGFAEGTEKALVADLAPAERRGFAFGIYDAVTGVGALLASLFFGLCVERAVGTTAPAFGLGAAPRARCHRAAVCRASSARGGVRGPMRCYNRWTACGEFSSPMTMVIVRKALSHSLKRSSRSGRSRLSRRCSKRARSGTP